jgi:hypothetical protein
VEVLPREREPIPGFYWEKIGSISGCLRSLITGFFLLPDKAPGQDRFKKTLFDVQPEN